VSQLSANLKNLQKLKLNHKTLLLSWWLDGINLLPLSSFKTTKRMRSSEQTHSLNQVIWSKVSQNTLNKVILEWEPLRKLMLSLTILKVANRKKRKGPENCCQRIDHMPWNLCYNYIRQENTLTRPCLQVPAFLTDMLLSLGTRKYQRVKSPSLLSLASSSEPSLNNQTTPTLTIWSMPSKMSTVTL